MLDDFGSFIARAYTAGALPVEGAIVRISGAEEANRDIAYSLVTDMDGLTEMVNLPAPNRRFSQAPNPAEQPYSVYNLEIVAEGYYPKRIMGVTVFPGINSVQRINMIPLKEPGNGNYPRGNVNAFIPEPDERE